MSAQIISREKIRQSAEQAFLSGQTLDDCPAELAAFQHEWAEAFRLAEFEASCEDSPCSL